LGSSAPDAERWCASQPPQSAKADIVWFQRRIHSLWKTGALEGGLALRHTGSESA
jgi:hypothetical protein